MKAFKKALTMILALIMVMSVALSASAAGPQRFKDVTENDWFYESVMRWMDAGVINGKSADTFAPDAPMKRGEFAKAMAETMGLEGNPDSVFADASHWADVYIARCYANGIVNGVPSDGKLWFYPEQEITREQAFAMMVRALNLNAGSEKVLAKFKDAADVSDWAREENSTATLVTYGAVVGNPDGTLNPKDSITRAEVLKILDRLVGVHVSKTGVVTTATPDTKDAVESGAKQAAIVVVHPKCEADVVVNVELVEEEVEVVDDKGEVTTVVVEKQAVAVAVTDKKGITTQAQMIPTATTTKVDDKGDIIVDDKGEAVVEDAPILLVTTAPSNKEDTGEKENVVLTVETKAAISGTNSGQENIEVEILDTCAKHDYDATSDDPEDWTCSVCGECAHPMELAKDREYTEAVHYMTCKACNKLTTAEPHTYQNGVCTVCGFNLNPAAPHAHAWDKGTVTKEATCTEKGVKTFKCECGETKTEEIEATGHTEVKIEGKAATCTEDGLTEGRKCTVCGAVTLAQETIKALGHDMAYEYNCGCHWQACQREGCDETTELEPHENTVSYDEYREIIECVCGAEKINHDYTDPENPGICGNCSETCGHEEGDALNEDNECEICGRDSFVAIATKDDVTICYTDLVEAIEFGGKVKLLADFDAQNSIVINKAVTIDLNGCTVSASEDTDGDGVFHVVEGGNLTINGEGTVNGVCASTYHMAIWADGGDVTINGGTYTNMGAKDKTPDDDQFDLIYAKGDSVVTINGGTFQCEDDPKWTLNLKDNSEAKIIVKGGTFFNYDPSNAKSENPVANMVAEDYEAIANDDGSWTVQYKYLIEDADDLASYNTNWAGKNVILMDDLEDTSVNIKAPYGNWYGVAHKGGIFDGNGKLLDFEEGPEKDGKHDNYGIMTSGGTIKNVTVTGVFRGIMIMNPTEKIIIDNVTIGDAEMCYAINTGEGDGTQDLVVTNSTIKGWSSYGDAIKSVSFTNCTFAQGDYYSDVFGRVVKPYVNAVFKNCEFGSQFYIDLSALSDDAKIVLDNCTINGEKLTAENWKELVVAEDTCGESQISIELRNGSYLTAENVVDYIEFK